MSDKDIVIDNVRVCVDGYSIVFVDANQPYEDPVIKVESWPEIRAAVDKLIAERGES